MNKFLFYFVSEAIPYFFMLLTFWMLVRFISWFIKVFIPAFKELIQDFREWRAEERSNKAKNEH